MLLIKKIWQIQFLFQKIKYQREIHFTGADDTGADDTPVASC